MTPTPSLPRPASKGHLKGKVILITGAGRGLGRASAVAFAYAGANVACVARPQVDLDSVVAEIKEKHHVEAIAISVDVLDPSSGAKVISETENKLGPVDMLLDNAGVTRFAPFMSENT